LGRLRVDLRSWAVVIAEFLAVLTATVHQRSTVSRASKTRQMNGLAVFFEPLSAPESGRIA
jgi:hypothetical protein